MTFTLTEEQNSIISAARDTTDNLAVIARAGAAKTSTLVFVAEALPSLSVLCLAFNKSIATEMAERLPSNCVAKTLHGLGYGAWNNFIPGRAKLNKGKSYQILRGLIDRLEDADDRSEAFESMSDIFDIISFAKQSGYLPESRKGHWRSLLTDDEFYLSLPLEPTELQLSLAQQSLVISWNKALGGEIDFDDMIYCPALCSVSWPIHDLYLVDEAQDLSSLNHHILRRMVKNRRIIAVGDPLQAIYGFRGASVNSMSEMIETFSMSPLYLTVSFRCARKIVENAQWLAPDMRYPEWATEGEVHIARTWSAEDVEIGDAIICRNNAPLFSLAIKLIQAGKLPEIAGRDIGAPIIKIMKKLGKPNMLKLAALEAVNDWEERELRRARNGAKGNVRDKAAIMRLMFNQTRDLGDAIAYLEHLLNRPGRIHLMTGHKSKGLEFDRVWFLDQHLCQIKQDQDANIKYVIETRAKNFLTYIESNGLIEAAE